MPNSPQEIPPLASLTWFVEIQDCPVQRGATSVVTEPRRKQTIVVDQRSLAGATKGGRAFNNVLRQALIDGRRILITSSPVRSAEGAKWKSADLRIVARPPGPHRNPRHQH